MSDRPKDYRREVQSTIVKSGLTGVAATALAVTVFSPAGLGNWVGTSVASGLGLNNDANAADNIYATLPPYPTPFSAQEIDNVRAQLSRTEAMMEITRAATEERIQHIRDLAGADLSVPSVEMSGTVFNRVAAAQPVQEEAESELTVASYAMAEPLALRERDRDLELAQLLQDHQAR